MFKKKKKFKSNASSIGVIGSTDGPTSLFVVSKNIDKYNFKLGKSKSFLKRSISLIRNNEK